MNLMTTPRIGRRCGCRVGTAPSPYGAGSARGRAWLARLGILALAVTTAAAAGGAAQERSVALAAARSPSNDGRRNLEVKVGDGRVKGAGLHPYANQWRVEVRNSHGKLLGLSAKWTDELRIVDIDSTKCLQRTQRAVFSKDGKEVGTTETVNVFDRNTMAPRSRHFAKHAVTPGQEEETRVEIAGRSVHWTRTAGGKSEDEMADLPEPVFDFYGGLYGLLFAALPLERGLSVEFPSLAEDGPRPTSVAMTVTGEEEMDAGHLGRRHAWIVESDTALGPMKLWISEEAPYILRLVYTAKDNGLTWTYIET